MNNPTQKIEGKDWITLPWIFSSNLNLFVEYATHLGNYACDSSDTVALEHGISQSTSDARGSETEPADEVVSRNFTTHLSPYRAE